MKELIKSNKLQYSNQSIHSEDVPYIIYDIDHKISSVTDYFARLCGFKNSDNAIGASVFDLKCPAVDIAPTFFNQDLQVIKSKQTKYYFNINHYEDNIIKCFHTTKSPIFKDNDIIGHESQNNDLNEKYFRGFIETLIRRIRFYNQSNIKHNISYELITRYDVFKLTVRESEILFLVAFGKSSSEIGTLLFLSPRTIETHINSIKLKLHLNKKSDLIEFALFKQLVYRIPVSLLGIK